MKNIFIIFLISILTNAYAISSLREGGFPAIWWQETLDKNVPAWEILPDNAIKGKSVILSKRNELGILSNFASTSIIFENKRYASLEGAWQSMKFPESINDRRYKSDRLPFSRSEVERMVGFKAKRAGGLASKLMKKHGVNFVTYKKKKMIYKTPDKGEHYRLIRQMMKAKLDQNVEVRRVLKATGKLVLLPDHHNTSKVVPPAWKYNEIWMDLRTTL